MCLEKLLVHLPCVRREVHVFCRKCTHKFTITGTQLEVVSLCSAAHSTTWESQPSVRGNPAGNLHLASGIFFAGCLQPQFSKSTRTEVELAGYGRCNSPGFSATYMTYSVLATEVDRIIRSEQIRVGESSAVATCVSMKREALKTCLEKLDASGVMVQSLTTGFPFPIVPLLVALYFGSHASIDTMEWEAADAARSKAS
ncbi:hypothetical protein HPB48_000581 [Haemaphysalis longicornis]|uniref:Uncharacterized protein n=1 Tax=Haemaphysalis longicornis TaxID=44386 RepID=A0A9J6GMD8_HAELO|nr:hypothetical protein HPB48_000581 [Haemaphysalis longicornis]